VTAGAVGKAVDFFTCRHHPDHLDPLPCLNDYELTYLPAYTPAGAPKDPTASKQVLAEQRIVNVQAIDIDAAVTRFEREKGQMVLTGKRLQLDEVGT